MARRYFGTDGVRGVVGEFLTPELVERLGRAASLWTGAATVFVGRDTRASGLELEEAFARGVVSAGGECILGGVLPTPAVALLALDLGVVISASHNPPEYNGVKFFDSAGHKLSDTSEEQIEELLAAAPGVDQGSIEHVDVATDSYRQHILDRFGADLSGLRIAVDCANGAASEVGPAALREAGADVVVINASPDGRNINEKCGSTHPEQLQASVVASGADLGVAFDGDADRCLAVDHTGTLVDGDQIMGALAIAAIDLHDRKQLRGDAIVATVMSNMGLRRALEPYGISVIETPVGDRNVLDVLEQRNLALGGEQSGHVIYADHATTGDGTLTGVFLLDTMSRRGRKLSELASVVTRVPQVLRNVAVDGADALARDAAFWSRVRDVDDELGDDGRVLVRPSGTEPLVRVMVEATDPEAAEAAVERLVDLVEHAAARSAPVRL